MLLKEEINYSSEFNNLCLNVALLVNVVCVFIADFSTGCNHLEMICVSWCHLITDSGIEQFTRYCTKLRTFICKGATQV